MGYAVSFRVLTGNKRRAKNDVPQKEHVPKVPFVVAYPVVGCSGMMGVMRSRGGDKALQNPGNRVQRFVFIKRFVPGNTGMSEHGYRRFYYANHYGRDT